MSGAMNTAPGQSARARDDAIAEWTPNRLASYDAAATTPRAASPPTTTGRPNSSGLRSSSTDT